MAEPITTSPEARTVAPEEPPRRRRRFSARSVREQAVVISFYVALVAVWELVVRAGLVAPYILPAPSMFLGELFGRLPLYAEHTMVTMNETLLGFALGSGVGFVLGLLIVYSRTMERIIYPAIIFTQTVPKLALAPLFTVWFGVGMLPKVLITALICLFPVLINTVTGLKSVDPRLRQLMNSVSASRWQLFRMIELPTALPSIFAGLQVGVTLAVVGALVGEWVGADRGLGYLIIYDNSQLRTSAVFASLVCVTVMGIVLFLLVRWLEKLLLPHRPHADLESLPNAGM